MTPGVLPCFIPLNRPRVEMVPNRGAPSTLKLWLGSGKPLWGSGVSGRSNPVSTLPSLTALPALRALP